MVNGLSERIEVIGAVRWVTDQCLAQYLLDPRGYVWDKLRGPPHPWPHHCAGEQLIE